MAYTDGRVVFAHVEHSQEQGRLIDDWLDNRRGNGSPPDAKRVRWRQAVREAIRLA